MFNVLIEPTHNYNTARKKFFFFTNSTILDEQHTILDNSSPSNGSQHSSISTKATITAFFWSSPPVFLRFSVITLHQQAIQVGDWYVTQGHKLHFDHPLARAPCVLTTAFCIIFLAAVDAHHTRLLHLLLFLTLTRHVGLLQRLRLLQSIILGSLNSRSELQQ